MAHSASSAQRAGVGAGIMLRSDGHALTSNHVTAGADFIKTTLHNGESYPGRLTVALVAENSGAAAAGLQGEDEIVSMGGEVIRNTGDLSRFPLDNRPGEEVSIIVHRGGDPPETKSTQGERPARQAMPGKPGCVLQIMLTDSSVGVDDRTGCFGYHTNAGAMLRRPRRGGEFWGVTGADSRQAPRAGDRR